MMLPDIAGDIREDHESLERYSTDMSGYRVRPSLIILPAHEKDVERSLEYAMRSGVPVTARGAGSNLSGSAVGGGLLLHLRNMRDVESLAGNRVRVQPGTVYEELNRRMAGKGLTLRYDVSSGGFSTVGGNTATRAGGLRSIKYGTVDGSLASVRFLCPAHGLVDTEACLLPALERDIGALRGRLQADQDTLDLLEMRRGLKSSSGFNLGAFIDYEDPADIVTHLMVGSVGTLGILTSLTMNLLPRPGERILYAAFFKSIESAATCAVGHLRVLRPSALELIDAFGISLVRGLKGIAAPPAAGAALLIEFDDEPGSRKGLVEELLGEQALSHRLIEDGPTADGFWKIRWTMLTKIKRLDEDENHRYLSFIDDMAVLPEKLVPFITDIKAILDEEKLQSVIYGHVGEGNLHIRPLVEKRDWRARVRRVTERCVASVLFYGGTLTAEHGSGRNRAQFLEQEWGPRTMKYFREIKNMFDPRDLLNPGVMFSSRDLTQDLHF
jgi:FAD/FMN-containing dehydrogenase